ncbi:indole-3-glycerol phosphate synthase [Salinimicrobium marinum]|uniref:Indole-3-glycerol phosphate synthase n=1 Tax=Salinimicrobium marinum TaxID=680283 RepID=A0A918SL08_9FLAO|nr:indole-3-glycerol phosphate synthase TrpC [Salinimicrobium marinum]GHA49013.1 indole-3-glycerol phosphate synthase [Salinimicrobium marinum]
MNILEKIALDKRAEVEEKKDLIPMKSLELMPGFSRKCVSLSQQLRDSNTGIIAEFKRRSPSVPDLNLNADVKQVTGGYEKAGASGISVLTDEIYFGGSMDDLFAAREEVKIPILRKDFMIDEYQILESKAIGADVILLIAALLNKKEIKAFSELAKSLGMDVLLEVHNEEELQKSIMSSIDMIGVNNRNLKNFDVDTNISKELSEKIPSEFVKVSESGISSTAAIKDLQKYNFKGFLIGGNFMKTEDPGKSAEEFIRELKSKK